MARKKPFPQRERDICNRVRLLREQLKLSRVQFGGIVGIDSALLANYEQCKARLNYDAARRIIKTFGVHPKWLASGEPPQISPGHLVPHPEILGVGVRAAFSEVFDEKFKGSLTLEIEADDDHRRLHLEWQFKHWIERWLEEVPAERLDWLANTLAHVDFLQRSSAQQDGPDNIKHRVSRLAQKRPFLNEIVPLVTAHFARVASQKAADAGKPTGLINDLTDSSESFKGIAHVKIASQWPELKRRLQKATEAVGAKPALAKVLNVDPTQISQWLSESKSAREPGGDYALRMLKWVELQERKTQ